MTLDDAIKKLLSARRRLQPEQGRIARRNARHAVLCALHVIRHVLDEEYPHQRKLVAERAVRNPTHWLRGFRQITPVQSHQLLLAGLPASQMRTAKNGPFGYYAREWIARALFAKVDYKHIVEAFRDLKKRKALDAMNRLRGPGGST